MKSAFLALSLLMLTGCSAQFHTINKPGQEYGFNGSACVNMPDLADKLKDGLSKMKACAVADAGVILVPKEQ